MTWSFKDNRKYMVNFSEPAEYWPMLQALACTDSARKSEYVRVYSELMNKERKWEKKQFSRIAINMLPIAQSRKSRQLHSLLLLLRHEASA